MKQPQQRQPCNLHRVLSARLDERKTNAANHELDVGKAHHHDVTQDDSERSE